MTESVFAELMQSARFEINEETKNNTSNAIAVIEEEEREDTQYDVIRTPLKTTRAKLDDMIDVSILRNKNNDVHTTL